LNYNAQTAHPAGKKVTLNKAVDLKPIFRIGVGDTDILTSCSEVFPVLSTT